MISMLSGACYAVRSVVQISNINTHINLLHLLLFCYKSGIIFRGNSSNSGKIFTLHKKIVRIWLVHKPRTSCRSLLKQLEILPVPCQYICSLMNFIINNQEIVQTNSSTHSIKTKNKHHIHRPNATLYCIPKKYILCWHKNSQQFTV
jgi:hypothetical protein